MRNYLTALLVLALSCSSLLAISTEKIGHYGNAIVARVADSNAVDDYVFRCNIKNYPPIIGKNIPIRIKGISRPAEPVSQSIKAEILSLLKKAKRIHLKNMQRDSQFRILADVYINNKNLADILIEKGLAQRGENSNSSPPAPSQDKAKKAEESKDKRYAASKNSKIFHRKDCQWVNSISEKNLIYFDSREKAIEAGKRPCKQCNP